MLLVFLMIYFHLKVSLSWLLIVQLFSQVLLYFYPYEPASDRAI